MAKFRLSKRGGIALRHYHQYIGDCHQHAACAHSSKRQFPHDRLDECYQDRTGGKDESDISRTGMACPDILRRDCYALSEPGKQQMSRPIGLEHIALSP